MTLRPPSAGVLVVVTALACAGAPALAAPLVGSPIPAGMPPTLLAQAQPPQRTNAATERRRRLGTVNNWGYWLSSFEMADVATAPHDLLVIDSEISANRTFEPASVRGSRAHEAPARRQHPRAAHPCR